MDSPRGSSFQPAFNLFVLAILLLRFPGVVQGGEVLRVKPKLVGHDELRRARGLSARPIDLPLGGGMVKRMWYTEIAIGTPPTHFQVTIDTGSDITWVDCEGCENCTKSTAEVKLETYNPELSKTARIVTLDERLCYEMLPDGLPEKSYSGFCEHSMSYGDGLAVLVYFVTDLVSFGQSNPTVGLANVTFGCGTKKKGSNKLHELDLGIEGLLGLSWSNQSIVHQMASSGRVRKEFAHCLGKDGGIFAIGHVVKPKLTTMTPLLPDGDARYKISVTAIEVGGHFHTHQYAATIDTGSTLNVLPRAAFEFTMEKIFSKHPDLTFMGSPDGPVTFPFLGSVDAEFPTFTYQVNMSHAIKLYPHDYCIPKDEEAIRDGKMGLYTVGFVTKENEFIIGDVTLRNRLFVYDLENKQIGWQDYNCSSSIELEDERGVCNIGAHNITAHPK